MEYESAINWLTRQGYHIIETKSSFWYDNGPYVYQAFPYHNLITPSNDEIQKFFKQSKAIGIRYSTPLGQQKGKLSYHVVYDQPNYELASLPKKARHDVNSGLNYATYQPISLERLAKEGWNLRKETLVRQNRQTAESRSFWERLCLSADGLPCFEAWGALHDNALVASLLACTIGDTVCIFYQQSLTYHRKFGVNNALTYLFTQKVIQRPGVRCIFYGLHSLDARPSVDQFKFRMGYSAKPVIQRIIFNPYIAPLIQPLSHLMLKVLLKIFPAHTHIAKAEGMVRFYLQGKFPVSRQEWPAALIDDREKILAVSG